MAELVRPSFWSGKRVLLTGHTGFKGAWLSIWLHQMGAKVHGVSLPPEQPSLFTQGKIDGLLQNEFLDIRETEKVAHTFKKSDPEIVIHMAAQSLVGKSYREPINTFATNVMGTANVLEAAKNTPSAKACVIITTDKCYQDNKKGIPHIETDPLGGFDPYSSSKACAELVTQSYTDSFFRESKSLYCASARAGNVIGGGDWAENRLIPDVIRSWMANKEVVLRSPGGVRPWQHVLEPLSGYLKLAQELYAGNETAVGAWNFSPVDASHRPALWIVEQLKARLPAAQFNIQCETQKGFHETHVLKLDSSKSQKQLNWHPKWPIEQTLDKVCDWYVASREKADVVQTCRKQIEEYSQ